MRIRTKDRSYTLTFGSGASHEIDADVARIIANANPVTRFRANRVTVLFTAGDRKVKGWITPTNPSRGSAFKVQS